jgi:hypothetical protein
MDSFIIITYVVGFSIISVSIALIINFAKMQKRIMQDYEQLSNLKNWYEKVCEQASYSYFIEKVEARGYQLIDQLNLLNDKLVKIQEHHKKLQQEQQKLHNNLLEQHKLFDEYFKNYS